MLLNAYQVFFTEIEQRIGFLPERIFVNNYTAGSDFLQRRLLI